MTALISSAFCRSIDILSGSERDGGVDCGGGAALSFSCFFSTRIDTPLVFVVECSRAAISGSDVVVVEVVVVCRDCIDGGEISTLVSIDTQFETKNSNMSHCSLCCRACNSMLSFWCKHVISKSRSSLRFFE